MMTDYRWSYVKTVVAAATLGLGAIVAARLAATSAGGLGKALIEGMGWTLGMPLEGLAMGGLIALYRDQKERTGKVDLFLAANAARSEAVLSAGTVDCGIRVRRLLKRLFGARWHLVGDAVEIRSLAEIRETLDSAGCLDALPFQTEMEAFCGQRAVIFRSVDKIYDYGRTKKLRRLADAVLLTGLRCHGSSHGGCQASCYLLWKSAWLRPVRTQDTPPAAQRSQQQPEGLPDPPRYVCQYTQLAAASTPLHTSDVRQDLRPLLAGNVTVRAFCIAILTQLFNAVQEARHGSGYPSRRRGAPTPNATVPAGLIPGDRVRVLERAALTATLDARGRHRGLWFDDDMIKHCGRTHTVLKRVDRIIDDVSGRMVEMKTPCFILTEADASGEFWRFCAQHEYPFWREAWLRLEARPMPGEAASVAQQTPPVPLEQQPALQSRLVDSGPSLRPPLRRS
jgi:hypothetical protein